MIVAFARDDYPFPEPTDAQREAITIAEAELNQLRENWRNSVDMFGSSALNADQQRRRTLTNLYNDYAIWPANAHSALDAVAEAYS